jgi:hypothetical protein
VPGSVGRQGGRARRDKADRLLQALQTLKWHHSANPLVFPWIRWSIQKAARRRSWTGTRPAESAVVSPSPPGVGISVHEDTKCRPAGRLCRATDRGDVAVIPLTALRAQPGEKKCSPKAEPKQIKDDADDCSCATTAHGLACWAYLRRRGPLRRSIPHSASRCILETKHPFWLSGATSCFCLLFPASTAKGNPSARRTSLSPQCHCEGIVTKGRANRNGIFGSPAFLGIPSAFVPGHDSNITHSFISVDGPSMETGTAWAGVRETPPCVWHPPFL